MNYENLKATIAANIYQNGRGKVTAEMVKTAINSVVDTLIAGGYLYKGVAHPGDAAETPDANVFYLATEVGTYTNKGGLQVADGEVAVLKYNGSWTKEVTGAATAAQVAELGQEVDEVQDKTIGRTYTIETNVENAWSSAFPFKFSAGITYKITKDCLGQLILATMSTEGPHIAANELQRITLTGGVGGVTMFNCTADAMYVCLYSGNDVPLGTTITIESDGKLRKDFDEYVEENNDKVSGNLLGLGSAPAAPLKTGGAFAVIGDSISTFNKAGTFYPGYVQYYPQGDVSDISQMFWYKLCRWLGCSSLINASYSGSTVTNINSYPDLYAKVQVVGSPDVCVICCGSNDSNGSAPLGDYDFTADISDLNESEFIPAYIKGVKTLLAANGKMQIVCLAMNMGDAYKNAIKTIAEHYSLFYIDCAGYPSNDALHPNAAGMEYIYKLISRYFKAADSPFRVAKNKLLSADKIPYQFIHHTAKMTPQHFCLGGDEYIMAQDTWPGETQTRMGGFAWWLNNGKVSKYAPLTINNEQYKIIVPTWANMTNVWTGGLIVAGQHMYHQNWMIGILDGNTGALKTSFVPPFASHLYEDPRTQVSVPFACTIEAGKTYTVVNNTNDNIIIRITTSYEQPLDNYVILDNDGNPCKKTLYNYGETYTFTAGADASYLMVYTSVNQGSTKTSVYLQQDVTDSKAVTAMCVYDMPASADMRLFIACDYNKTIYNISAKDGSDVREYAYPTGIDSICGMCFDEWGVLYIASNDISLAPNDGNTIFAFRVLSFLTFEAVGSFVIPRKADGGMAIKDGILYTYDNRTATINKISLGGVALAYNGTPKIAIPLSDSFRKMGIAVSGGAGEANVIYDDNKFKMWFSRGSIAYCESEDGLVFDEPVNVIANASRSHVFKYNDTWHIYYILTDTSANRFKIMYHATSADGVTWGTPTQVMTAAEVATACSGSVWSDFQQFGSMYVGYIGGKWRMLFEGKTETDNTWSIGYAESSDMNTWTIDPNSPQTKNYMSFGTAKGMRMIGRPKIFYYDSKRGIWWLTCHYSQYLDIPTRVGLAWTKDLKRIYLAPASPLLDFTNIEETDQLADAWLMEQDGDLYLYNSCVRNYSPQHSYIQVSKLDMRAMDFIEMAAIIDPA